MSLKSPKISSLGLVELLAEARNAELCRDAEWSRRILSEVWTDFDRDPQFSESMSLSMQADFLRQAGFFLSNYGAAKAIKNYQERGKNLLTRAIEIFDSENLHAQAGEARIMLALCYWYEGAAEESNAILSSVEQEFEQSPAHPVYLKARVNRLLSLCSKREYAEAMAIIEDLDYQMKFCDDVHLLAMYHNESGIVCRRTGRQERAFTHYKTAVKFSRKAHNRHFEAKNLNNLALLCRDVGKCDEAHEYVNDALRLVEQLGESGWAAHILDTKALIYINEGNLDKASECIDLSIDIFRTGEDYAGLADALINRAKISTWSGNNAEAITDFSEAVGIARQRIGEFAVRNYVEEFNRLFYPIRKLGYHSEIKVFKKELIVAALTDADGQIVRAAKQLEISHQSLSEILNHQFPEIYDELGIERRQRGVPLLKGKAKQRVVSVKNIKKEKEIPEIKVLSINHSDIILPRALSGLKGEFLSFLIPGGELPELETENDIIVLTVPVEEAKEARVVAQHKLSRDIVCLRIDWDHLLHLIYVKEDEHSYGEPILLDDYNIFGQIVAYYVMNGRKAEKVPFKLFPEVL